MSGLPGIARDSAWLFGGRLASQVLTVLFTVLLVARLGLGGLGEYAFVAAVVALANVITTFGTDMVLIRDIAGGGRADRWEAALAVQLGLSVVAIGLIWVGAPSIPGQGGDVVAALRIYSLSLIPAAVFSVSTAALRGAGRMARQATLGAALALIQLVMTWLLLGPEGDLGRVVAILLGVQVAAATIAWGACAASLPAFRSLAGVGGADVAGMVRASAPIGLLGLLGVLYQRAGVIVLSMFVGPTATGWFAGASKIVEASKAGHVALFGALYPAMARARATTADALGSDAGLGWSLRLSIGLAAAVSAALLMLGPLLVGRLYGPAFAPASVALAILALSVVPSTLATYRSLDLVASRREHATLRALLLSLAVLLALLATLVPALGWVGACWAVLGAEMVQATALSVTAGQRPAGPPLRRDEALLARGLTDGAR